MVATSFLNGRNAPLMLFYPGATWSIKLEEKTPFNSSLFMCKPHLYSENNPQKPACGWPKGRWDVGIHMVTQSTASDSCSDGRSALSAPWRRVFQHDRPLPCWAFQAQSINKAELQDLHTSEKPEPQQELRMLGTHPTFRKYLLGK